MEPRPTLQNIAELAGVGKATVSLALRNHPKISAATRARVKAAAEKLNYRPDPALARIAAHRWRTREHPSDFVVAYVTMPHPWTKVENLPEMRRAATEHGDRMGYRVEHFRLQDYSGPAHLAKVIFHRGIRGVLVGQILRDDFVHSFPWDQFTAVGCHVGYHQPPVNVVLPDFHHAVVRAWKEAAAAGYTRIGTALLQEMQAVDLFDKVSAALFCQSRVTPDLPPIPVAHFPMNADREFNAWMKEHQPDVVLGFNSTVGAWLDRAGYRIPDDVAFASLDSLPQMKHRELIVSGMNPDYALIGRTAVEQLDLLLRTNQSGVPARPLMIHVPSEWIGGETLPAKVTPKGKQSRKRARRGATEVESPS